MTSVGLKCLRGERATCPSRTGRSGRRARARGASIFTDVAARTPPSASAGRRSGSSGPTGRIAHARSRSRSRDARRPGRELARASTRSGGRGGGAARRAASRTADVVLDVRRRHDDGAAAGRTRTRARSNAAEARRVEVLDDLDERRGVEARQPRVAVGQRAVEELDPLALALGHPVEPQAPRGDLQRPAPRRRRRRSRSNRRPRAARSSSRPSPQPRSSTRRAPRRLQDAPATRPEPLVAQRDRAPRAASSASRSSRLGVGRLVARRQLRERLARQALGARGSGGRSARAPGAPASQPSPRRSSFSISSSLDPVVLLVVEHRDEHVEVREQVARAGRVAAQPQRHVAARRPTPGTLRRAACGSTSTA